MSFSFSNVKENVTHLPGFYIVQQIIQLLILKVRKGQYGSYGQVSG
jgi:hypothetical protein